jgi:hypothetical protein
VDVARRKGSHRRHGVIENETRAGSDSSGADRGYAPNSRPGEARSRALALAHRRRRHLGRLWSVMSATGQTNTATPNKARHTTQLTRKHSSVACAELHRSAGHELSSPPGPCAAPIFPRSYRIRRPSLSCRLQAVSFDPVSILLQAQLSYIDSNTTKILLRPR